MLIHPNFVEHIYIYIYMIMNKCMIESIIKLLTKFYYVIIDVVNKFTAIRYNYDFPSRILIKRVIYNEKKSNDKCITIWTNTIDPSSRVI